MVGEDLGFRNQQTDRRYGSSNAHRNRGLPRPRNLRVLPSGRSSHPRRGCWQDFLSRHRYLVHGCNHLSYGDGSHSVPKCWRAVSIRFVRHTRPRRQLDGLGLYPARSRSHGCLTTNAPYSPTGAGKTMDTGPTTRIIRLRGYWCQLKPIDRTCPHRQSCRGSDLYECRLGEMGGYYCHPPFCKSRPSESAYVSSTLAGGPGLRLRYRQRTLLRST